MEEFRIHVPCVFGREPEALLLRSCLRQISYQSNQHVGDNNEEDENGE